MSPTRKFSPRAAPFLVDCHRGHATIFSMDFLKAHLLIGVETWRTGAICVGLLVTALASHCGSARAEPLQISVYCTAGDVQRHMATPEDRQQVLRTLQPLRVTHLFLE